MMLTAVLLPQTHLQLLSKLILPPSGNIHDLRRNVFRPLLRIQPRLIERHRIITNHHKPTHTPPNYISHPHIVTVELPLDVHLHQKIQHTVAAVFYSEDYRWRSFVRRRLESLRNEGEKGLAG